MYNLGEHFNNINSKHLLSQENAIFRGNTYRITLLSERLVRLEYSPSGVFNDLATSIVKNRFFSVPEFSKKEDEKTLILETSYFVLTYAKESAFSSRTLFAKGKDSTFEWNFGQKEVRNLGGIIESFDNASGTPKLFPGLFSTDGFATIDDSNSLKFDEYSNVSDNVINNYIDLYLFIYNKDFGLCLKDYFTLTGMPPLISRYALGNWWSRDYDYTQQEVLDLIEKFKRHSIPLSVFLLDSGWSKTSPNTPEIRDGFSFNSERFPNPQEFIQQIHDNGLKFGIKINPQKGFTSVENSYEEAKKYFLADQKGVINFDIYNAKSVDVFLKLFIHPLEKLGVDIFWNDYNPGDSKKMYLMNYYSHKDAGRLKKRSLLLLRNSVNDVHLNNVMYSGKIKIGWEYLKSLPFYTLSAANIGASFWSHDVGGSLSGIEDNDLYLRSVQFGVFSPILRFNTEKGKYFKREPWKWDVVTESIAVDYLKLRHKLIPYIYSEAYRYHKEGKVLIQPFYYYDLLLYDDENYVNQYFFGSSFMISPIIKPMDEVINRTIQKFYMPNGVWYDFKTGKRFLGNHKYIAFYPIADYPIFVRQGSIIPMAGENDYMSYNNPKELEIHVFPGQSNNYHLYEDDGETMAYLNGSYCITEFDYNYRKSNYTLIIRQIEGDGSVIPPTRNYKIVFRNTKKSENVVVNENENVISDIECEGTDNDFIVKIKNVNTTSQIVINCYGEDIEIDSIKLLKDDIDSILFDLKINTILKDDIAQIMFSEEIPLGKKRIAIKKLRRKGLDPRSVKIFLKLLEYMEL